jgi:glycine/D-amino acid oxidase-like deaminating enzyme
MAAPPPAPLEGDAITDVVVIGAGFSGLIAALELTAAGRPVIVLDAAPFADNASAASAGQVGPLFYGAKKGPEAAIARLGQAQGERLNRTVAASGRWLFDTIETLGIACEARRGLVCVSRTEESLRRSIAGFERWRPYGGTFSALEPGRVPEFVSSPRYIGGVVLEDGGFLNPALLLAGLVAAVRAKGVAVHFRSAVTGARKRNGVWEVSSPGGRVVARNLLIACGTGGGDIWPGLDRAVLRVPCGVATTEPLADSARALLPSGGPIVDMDDKAVFAPAVTADGRLAVSYLMSDVRADPIRAAEPAMRRLRRGFPDQQVPIFTRFSSGLLGLTPDGLPRLFARDGMIAVTGCNGLTLGAVAARQAARLILEEPMEGMALPPSELKPVPGGRMLSAFFRRALVPIVNRFGA